MPLYIYFKHFRSYWKLPRIAELPSMPAVIVSNSFLAVTVRLESIHARK